MRTLITSLTALSVATLSVAAIAGTASAQTAIRMGQTVGSLSASDALAPDDTYFDCFRFVGTPGQSLTITLRSSDFDAYLKIGTGSCDDKDVIKTNDDGAEGSDSRLNTVLGSEPLFIHANSLNEGETGAYTLSLTAGPPPRPIQSGTAIRIGQTVNGTLAEGDSVAEDDSFFDCHILRGAPGSTVSVTMRSDDFDTYLAVGRGTCADFDQTDSDDDGANGTDSLLEVTLGDEPLIIRANSLGGGQTGDYSLSVNPSSGGSSHSSEDQGNSSGSSSGGDIVGQLLTEIPAAMTSNGAQSTSLGETRTELAQGDSEDWTIDLAGPGAFMIVGVCDESCSDLDLAVYDMAGEMVGSDTQDDDAPMVGIETPGRYRVSVSMPSCQATTCEAGVAALMYQ